MPERSKQILLGGRFPQHPTQASKIPTKFQWTWSSSKKIRYRNTLKQESAQTTSRTIPTKNSDGRIFRHSIKMRWKSHLLSYQGSDGLWKKWSTPNVTFTIHRLLGGRCLTRKVVFFSSGVLMMSVRINSQLVWISRL